jgi:hypothetical protein
MECPNKDNCEFYSVECRRDKFDYKYCMQYRYPPEDDKRQNDICSDFGVGGLFKSDISRIINKTKKIKP